MIAGLPFGAFVVLVSIGLFALYAHRAPGVQSLGFFWGLFNGLALAHMVEQMDNPIGQWLTGIFETITHPPIDSPPWVNESMATFGPPAGIALAVLAGYLVWTKILSPGHSRRAD